MAENEKDNFDIELDTKDKTPDPENTDEITEETAEEQTEEKTAEQPEQPPAKEQESAGEAPQDAFDYLDDVKEGVPDDELEDFEAIDVSEPRAPVREMDIIEEALAIRRRDWVKMHLSYIYAIIGVVVVGLIVLGIYLYYQNANPMSRFVSSLSKDFSSSFNYEVQVTEDDKAVMSYDGSINVNRSKHELEAIYEADYNRYTYTGAVYARNKNAVKGSFYNGKWTTRDCSDNAQDFFEFDKAFRSGGFDGGAFLRFTGLTSDYSTRELTEMVGVLKKRLSTDSPIATIKSDRVEGGTRYTYDIDLYELFTLIQENGASVFYRATDYDKFVKLFEDNKSIIQNADCTLTFVVDSAGYMSSLDLTVDSEGKSYGLSCRMSDFAKAEVEIPDSFFKAAQITPEE